MGLNPNALILPARGTVFVAPIDTTPPTVPQLDTISPTSPPAGWECIGHTSKENLPKYGKDGGDANQYGSWWDDAIDTAYDPVTWNLGFASLQSDALSLGMAFGGGTLDPVAGTFSFGNVDAVPRALLVLMVGGVKRRGLYHPNTSITLGDAPEIATDAFFEIPMLAQLLNSAATGKAWSGKRFQIIDKALVAPVTP